jgi:ribosome-associated toxin RatA of RatAB toxin-antitoxin module
MSRNQHFSVITAALALTALAAPAAAELDENLAIFTSQVPEAGSSISWGQAVIVMDKPIDEVLPIIRDYANYAQFMPNFTKSRVLAQRGSRAMVYMEVSVAKGAFTLWGQLSLAERPTEDQSHVVEAHLMEGNVDTFDARFTLTPLDGGTRTQVDFRILVDPAIPLPSSTFSRENEKAAGRAVRALRLRVFEGPQGSS